MFMASFGRLAKWWQWFKGLAPQASRAHYNFEAREGGGVQSWGLAVCLKEERLLSLGFYTHELKGIVVAMLCRTST